MISLDYRSGSGELAPLIRSYGIDVAVKKLEFGDLAWEGNGPEGKCAVTVERKRIADLIQSMQSRRLSGHQLPGMADQYDYAYLIVEGIWRPAANGALDLGQGSFTSEDHWGGRWTGTHGRQLLYRAVDNYLATLELHAGIIYRRTLSMEETVAVIVDLYRWWTDKLWEQHSSHLGVYAPAEAVKGKGRLQLARREVSLAEKWAMQLPGIDAKAREVAVCFGSGRALANATEEDWQAIKGIGKKTAKAAVRMITAEGG